MKVIGRKVRVIAPGGDQGREGVVLQWASHGGDRADPARRWLVVVRLDDGPAGLANYFPAQLALADGTGVVPARPDAGEEV